MKSLIGNRPLSRREASILKQVSQLLHETHGRLQAAYLSLDKMRALVEEKANQVGIDLHEVNALLASAYDYEGEEASK